MSEIKERVRWIERRGDPLAGARLLLLLIVFSWAVIGTVLVMVL